ncbi:MAG: hypothetical protein H6Q58_1563 [Firmicutes bacterium]|nr:hypothetical protein [Bacillota bacterium]
MKKYLNEVLYGIAVYIAVAILALMIYGALFLLDRTETATMNQTYLAGAVLSLIVSFAFAWKSKPRSKAEAGRKGLIWMATSILLLVLTIAPGFKVVSVLLGVFGFWFYMFGILLGPILYAFVMHLG